MKEFSMLPEQVLDADADNVSRLLRELRVVTISARHWRMDTPSVIAERTLDHAFFYLPLHGGFEVYTDAHRSLLRPGQILIVPAGVCTRASQAGRPRSLEVLAVHCHLYRGHANVDVPLFDRHVLELPHPDWWALQFKRFVSLLGRDGTLGQLFGENLIRQFLANLVIDGHSLIWTEQQTDSRILKVMEVIEAEYASDLSVEQLAGRVELSPSRFRTLFWKETHFSPRLYLIQARLRKAMFLLTHTDKGIKEIAASTGFRDAQYFHRTFRRQCGRTPSEYRRSPHPDT